MFRRPLLKSTVMVEEFLNEYEPMSEKSRASPIKIGYIPKPHFPNTRRKPYQKIKP